MRDLDGRVAQGWGGLAPDGVHVNVVLARRGSPTAASLLGVFTVPRDGFTPVLASIGPDQPSYETSVPPVLILPKTSPASETAETLLFGAAQLGAVQGVLDAVAEGVLPGTDEHLVFVSLWIDPSATNETSIRRATRTAVSTAVAEAVQGRPAEAVAALVAARDTITNPFYDGFPGPLD